MASETCGREPRAVLAGRDRRDTRHRRSWSRAVLTFQIDAQGVATDVETGTVWDVERGLATEGPLRGAAIQKVPYTPAFDWAWEDFFPHSTFWGDNNGKVPSP